MKITTIKKRSDFVKVGERGKKVSTAGFLLLALKSEVGGQESGTRIGYTVTKKQGDAVTRNRIRRRLREVVRKTFPDLARLGYDYVIIARTVSAARPYEMLIKDLRYALHTVHKGA